MEKISPSLPIVNPQNTYTIQNDDSSIQNEAKDSSDLTSCNYPNKPSLADKLKSASNLNIEVTAPMLLKRPAPSTTSQPLSPKSTHSSSPPSIMKPPNTSDSIIQPSKNEINVNKKPKIRTSTSSNDSFYSYIDEGLDPAQELFNSNTKY